MRRKSRHLISCPRCLQRCSQHCRRVLFLCWRQFTVKCDVLCNSGNCTLRAGNEVWVSERADAYRPLWLITSACLPNTPCAPLTLPGKPLPEFHMAHSWVIVHATSFPESTWLLEFQWPQHLNLHHIHILNHRKNCECCPGHYLIVNQYSSMSRFKFRDLSVKVNCVTNSLNRSQSISLSL